MTNPHAFVAYRQAMTLHAAAEASALAAVRAALGPRANLFTDGAESVAGDLLALKRVGCDLQACAAANLRA